MALSWTIGRNGDTLYLDGWLFIRVNVHDLHVIQLVIRASSTIQYLKMMINYEESIAVPLMRVFLNGICLDDKTMLSQRWICNNTLLGLVLRPIRDDDSAPRIAG